MTEFKYYVLTYMTRDPREIFRGEPVSPEAFGSGRLWRAKIDGSWSEEESDIRPLLNSWMKGEFDAEDDEISEDAAVRLLESWQMPGAWPGRP